MTVTVHNCEQGSAEWHELRRGKITASNLKLIMTPTLKVANNDKARAYAFDLAAQRISGFSDASDYQSDDMMRGHIDEVRARMLYHEHVAPVETCGLMVRTVGGVELAYSPDGLVGDSGLIEIKSRRQKYHVQTIAAGEVPPEHWLQVQGGLLISGREWIDYISYCGGLPMGIIRTHPDKATHAAIIEASQSLEASIAKIMRDYEAALASYSRLIKTERADHDGVIYGGEEIVR